VREPVPALDCPCAREAGWLRRSGTRGRRGARRGPDGLADAQLLILDEPTAALDAEAEYEVYRRFGELTRGRATLLISHRFSTVRMADAFVVLEDGRVVEQGSHDELVRLPGGTYARLYELQAARYR
jgi:ATP-binding cassette subfamily B protein